MKGVDMKETLRGSAWLAALALLLAGCAMMKPAPPPKPPRRTVPYRRVAVIEFVDRTRHGSFGYAKDFTRALAEKLADWTTATDVVVVPREALRSEPDPFFSGEMPVHVLVQVRRECLAEAVVFGSLEQIDPYRMPSALVSLKVVDTADATTLFALSEQWDAAELSVLGKIDAYYERNKGSDDCRLGPDLFLNSPRYFLRVVADQMAYRIASSL